MQRPALAFLLALLAGTAAAQAPPRCEISRAVVFAGLDYDSAQFHNAVARFILKNAFGCATDEVPGAVIPLLNGLARGDVDVDMEVWKDNVTEAWNKAEAAGQVVDLGVNFPDAVQGWYVPRYLGEGPDAPAPDLRSVADLPKYKALFADPEEPRKGRFYNCIPGWNCEIVNTRKLAAYGLDKDFTNFRPGSGAALDAAIESAILRKRPILFYYWGPTWLLGKLGDQVKMLEEPAYDPVIWKELTGREKPARATAYPTVAVHVGANRKFAEAAPGIARFLTAYETTGAQVSEALAYMQENKASADQAAVDFLKGHPGIWTKWLTPEQAGRVKAALGK
jgi:glycine betaine/proline transport system substrate-binding protein